jgi:hypothetical protein
MVEYGKGFSSRRGHYSVGLEVALTPPITVSPLRSQHTCGLLHYTTYPFYRHTTKALHPTTSFPVEDRRLYTFLSPLTRDIRGPTLLGVAV